MCHLLKYNLGNIFISGDDSTNKSCQNIFNDILNENRWFVKVLFIISTLIWEKYILYYSPV